MDISLHSSDPKGLASSFEKSTIRDAEQTSTTQHWWSEADERMVKLKLDLFLLPLLVAGFFVLQLDRINISNALTSTLTEDLHITTDDVNLGAQLLFIGIVIFEIPSNFILQKLGPSIWLTGQIGIWGLVALAQAWCTNIHSFYATRFLLGMFEAGYIPGAQYMLSTFYKRTELASRTAIFYFGNYFAAATGSLIAAGILELSGKHGLSGWQWLFIIEGIMTLIMCCVFIVFLPESPDHTRPVHGLFDLFSDRERLIMKTRVILDDPSKDVSRIDITPKVIADCLSDYRLWLHMTLNVVALAPKGGLQLYGPKIIKSMGFSTTKANCLNSVSNFAVVVFSFLISFASDRTRQKGIWCIVASVWSLAFAAGLYSLPLNADKWTRYAIFECLGSGNALAQGLNDAWVSINARTPQKRSVGLAMAVIGSNLGGLAGQQLFRTSDAPKYPKAFAAILGLYAGSVGVVGVVMWVYWWCNRRLGRTEESLGVVVDGDEDEEGRAKKPWRYQL
ncbi:MAG: hypothetical protein M1834_009505 [Cirrosporium novae-zelandiae]|nr:MAG: hypothetical protein M1834_009505 [Cirrosporium novae-zelandiae]